MKNVTAGREVRRIVRASDRACLATRLAEGGGPYASLVLSACEHDGTPVLLLSDLADHTRNIAADPRVALLFDATAGLEDPLSGPRVTLTGRARAVDAPRLRARYLARHPGAATYADFRDFRLYRVAVERAHFVAGFGRVRWLDGEHVLFRGAAEELVRAEQDILARINDGQTPTLLAQALGGRRETGWIMTGVDPEGCDLRTGAAVTRLDFAEPVRDPVAAGAALKALEKEARDRRRG